MDTLTLIGSIIYLLCIIIIVEGYYRCVYTPNMRAAAANNYADL
jgi:hypothetical protein